MTVAGHTVKTISTSEDVNIVSTSPFADPLAANWVAYAGDRRLSITRVDRDSQAVQEVHHGSRPTCIAWSQRSLELASPLLATGGKDNHVRVVSISTDMAIEVHEGHTGYINACAFLGGAFMASTGDDQTTRLWDINKGACLKVFKLKSAGRQLFYSAEDPYKLVAVEERGLVQTYDLRHNQPSSSITVPVVDEPLIDADICPFDRSRLVVAMGHRQLLVNRDNSEMAHCGSHAARLTAVRWSHTQRDVFASRDTSGHIRIHHCLQGGSGDLKHADGSPVTGETMGWMPANDCLVVGGGKRLHFIDIISG